MGAVLGLTSDGTRHRPVHRGVWLSEADFQQDTPALPANVDPIELNTPQSPKATIRQKLAAHAQNAVVQRVIAASIRSGSRLISTMRDRTVAHARNRSGRHREDPLVDATGVLPDGRAFQDAVQFATLSGRSSRIKMSLHRTPLHLRFASCVDDR
ncbi:MAG: DUF1588 domain-containing protein [Pirellulales bacterium]